MYADSGWFTNIFSVDDNSPYSSPRLLWHLVLGAFGASFAPNLFFVPARLLYQVAFRHCKLK